MRIYPLVFHELSCNSSYEILHGKTMSATYKLAASIIRKSDTKRGSIKSLVFNSNTSSVQKKKLYALVCNTLKKRNLLQAVLDKSKLIATEPRLTPTLALVLIYDYLLGKGICCGGPLKQMIHRHKVVLKQVYLELSATESFVTTTEDGNRLPRYVRVNSLKMTEEGAIKKFQELGYSYEDRETAGTGVDSLGSKTFHKDSDLPNVLVFPSGTDFTTTDLYQEGAIFLQDKASCIPASVLDPPPGSYVIDACAAPGNKTTHLAAIMGDTGHIMAFDRDAKRFKTLKGMVRKAGAKCITVKLADFLQVRPTEHDRVEYILLDPSCSGSGIANRDDHLTSVGTTKESVKRRLKSLSAFQYKILCHALKFPNVKRVVYSTCSVYPEENELVVQAALRKNSSFKLVGFMPQWKQRGLPIFEEASLCLRASPEKDNTTGFFVAKIERFQGTRDFSVPTMDE